MLIWCVWEEPDADGIAVGVGMTIWSSSVDVAPSCASHSILRRIAVGVALTIFSVAGTFCCWFLAYFKYN